MEINEMEITDLRVNHLKNPCGYHMDSMTFSWVTKNKIGKRQSRARFSLSKTLEFSSLIFDSGECDSLPSVGYSPKLVLEPEHTYYWKVEVWDECGDHGESEPAFFRTGKRNGKWKAAWISHSLGANVQPLFQKTFELPDDIKEAWISISGLGVFETYINRRKVSDEYLTPYHTDYTNWVQYFTWDITDSLKKGRNAIGVMVGNGWYRGRFGYIDKLDKLFGDTLGIICEIRVELLNGDVVEILSDKSWKCHTSAIVESSIYDGEVYDSREECVAFSDPDRDLATWDCVRLWEPVHGKLTERLSPPVRVQKRVQPIEIIYTSAGEQILDFGQNMTGWIECELQLERGQTLIIKHGEIMQNGNFYNKNLRTAKAEYRCIGDGKKKIFRAHFTFFGFRYAKIEGIEKIDINNFTAVLLHTDMERRGGIITSDKKLNQLIENIWWSQCDNFLDVPTDCPQRDERMGWTGDAQVFSKTATFNGDTAAFYRKYMYDMLLEQRERGGSVPYVIPDILQRIYAVTGEGEPNPAGASVWGDAATIIPWMLYCFYGDKELLREQFESMEQWVDYLYECSRKEGESYLQNTGFQFGDWLALDQADPDTNIGATDPYYIASVFYYHSTWLTAKAAKILGDEVKYQCLKTRAENIRQAIRQEYFTLDGNLKLDTQTAIVLALHMNIVDDEYKTSLAQRLGEKIKQNGGHLDTGFAGTPYLCLALSQNDQNHLAYELLLNESYPGWLYAVNLGATTIWERWDSVLPDGTISKTEMNSLNHYAYGSIAEWMYRVMCGLNPRENSPGFTCVDIRPMPNDLIQWVKMRYKSVAGLYEVSWKYSQYTIDYQITVPFNAEAVFTIPENQEIIRVMSEKEKIPIYGNKKEVHIWAGTYKIMTQQVKGSGG